MLVLRYNTRMVFKQLQNALDKFFGPVTIEDVIAQDLEKAQTTIHQCDSVIRDHRFQKHMALAKIAALEDWRRSEDTSSRDRFQP